MSESIHKRAAAAILAVALVLAGVSAGAAQASGLGAVTGVSVEQDKVHLEIGDDEMVVHVVRPDIVKVDYRPDGAQDAPTAVVDPAKKWGSGNTTSIDTSSDPIVVTTTQLRIEIARDPARLAIFDAAGDLVLREQAAEGVHSDGVRFNHTPGENFYGVTGNATPFAENDPKQNIDEGMQRNDGGHVSANTQGDGGAPLAFTNRYGLLVDSVDGDFDITDDTLEFSGVSTGDVSYYVAVGRPKQVMGAVAEISGKPAMFPKWAHGFSNSEWGTSQSEVEAIVAGYRERNIPLDAFVLDFDFKAWGEDDYGEFRWNSTSGAGNVHPNKFPDGASGAFAEAMRDKGVNLVGIMKPRVIVEKDGGGTTAQGQWGKDNDCFYPGREDYREYFSQRLANDVDFAKKRCRDWYWEHAKPLADTGIVGWWNDEADEAGGYIFDSLQHLNMQRTLYEGQRASGDSRVYSLNRNYYLGAQRYAYGMWSGDIDAGFDSMGEQRTRMLTSTNIGQTRWGMDIGGFGGDPSAENYARWMQFGAFVPLYRVHGALDKQRQPWVYGPTAERAAKEAIELRYRLLPYIYAHERVNHETGIGLVRPLFYEFPTDPTAANLTSQWMFGESLLVAPVVQEGASTKRVYLPQGTWTDYSRGTTYTGPTTIEYPVDEESWQDIPLFVREGAIIPSQDVQQHVGEKPVKQQDLDVFPGAGKTDFTVYDDDGQTYAYESDGYFKQRVTAQRTPGSVVVETQARTGIYDSGVEHYIVKINKTAGTAATINGSAPTRFGDLDELRKASGEGWTTGTDSYGPYTAVRVEAGAQKKIVVDGDADEPSRTKAVDAEDAALSEGAQVASNHAGYSGDGFVDGYWKVGASTTFTVDAARDGRHPTKLRYSNGNDSAKTLSMEVNGVRNQVTLPPTGSWDDWAEHSVPVDLKPGGNTISFRYGTGDSGNVNLDRLSIGVAEPPCSSPIEAEQTTRSGGARAVTEHLDYSGTGFVDGYWNPGASTEFTVQAGSAGSYTASLRYANATGSAKTLTMAVNGKAEQIRLPHLANWDTWVDHTMQVQLEKGANKVSFSYRDGDSGNVNLDRMSVAPGDPPCTATFEAEDMPVSDGAGPAADHLGYAGSGFVDGYTSRGASTKFTVHAGQSGTYPVRLRYANATGSAKTVTMEVNGTPTQLTLPSWADWDTWENHTVRAPLVKGANTIAFTYGDEDSGNVNLDQLAVTFP